MFRVIILLVLLAVSFTVVKLLRAKWERRADKSIKNNKQQSDNMLKCACCGVYIPEKQAVIEGDEIFCSLEHAKQHKQHKK